MTLPTTRFNIDETVLYALKPDEIHTPEQNYKNLQILFGYDEETEKQMIRVYEAGTCNLLLNILCYDSEGQIFDKYYVTALCSVVIDLENLQVYNLDVSDSKLFESLIKNELTVPRLIELYQDQQ